jgi:hypothetical protein
MVRVMPKLDWTQRESVRADLRRKVRRLLAMYGYPPDLSEDATQVGQKSQRSEVRSQKPAESRQGENIMFGANTGLKPGANRRKPAKSRLKRAAPSLPQANPRFSF